MGLSTVTYFALSVRPNAAIRIGRCADGPGELGASAASGPVMAQLAPDKKQEEDYEFIKY